MNRADRRILYHGWFMQTDVLAVTQYWWDNLLVDRNEVLKAVTIPILGVELCD